MYTPNKGASKDMKKQFHKSEKLNNEGLTLVELLITIMLLAIVSTAVFGFMTDFRLLM